MEQQKRSYQNIVNNLNKKQELFRKRTEDVREMKKKLFESRNPIGGNLPADYPTEETEADIEVRSQNEYFDLEKQLTESI